MNIKKIVPHLVSLTVFIVVALLYFHPTLKGHKLSQSDIIQHIGMAKEVNDFREVTGEEPYWTESAFSGMPTYQIGTYFPNDFITTLDRLIRFLPRPADYLFLYFIGFYLLLTVFKVEWKLAIVGSLAFGFSTYLILIFGAGHNAKAHAIGYMPMVLAGILLIFKKRYLLGFTTTGLTTALEISANHPQMTYYLLFSILVLVGVELVDAIRNNKLSRFIKQASLILTAMLLAVGVNSTRLMATKEYADISTRGNSSLTVNPDGTEKDNNTGLTKEYITQFSYGIPETFNLMVPRYMGGGTVEELNKDSKTYQYVKSIAGSKQADGFIKNVFTYWGNQPIVEGPAYIGAVIFFTFFLGTFLVKGTIKHWLVGSTVFAILLSWGKNFEPLTNFFIDYIPLYNKFRAVSSLQVIAELCVPLLGVLAIKKIFISKIPLHLKREALKKALYVSIGLVILGWLYATLFSTFEGIRDANYEQYEGLLDALKSDRRSLLYIDSLRSMALIGLCFGIFWLFLEKKLNQSTVTLGLAVLILVDLLQVDLRYLNEGHFKTARKIDSPFTPTSADLEIQKDTSHYRVANFTVDPFQDGRTSYFHKSIGGYHAAKMGRYQDLIEYHLSKQNLEVFNMLNVKYFILPGLNGEEKVQQNPNTNGNAWFVDQVRYVSSADEEIRALNDVPTKNVAVVDASNLKTPFKLSSKKDSTAIIKLTKYTLNSLVYESFSSQNQFAVFSEIYYKNGWNAYIDGELKPHFIANYILRAMEVPSGSHTIEFKFEPEVIKTGNVVTLISYLLIVFIPTGWFFYNNKK